jgi:hypothetical protein
MEIDNTWMSGTEKWNEYPNKIRNHSWPQLAKEIFPHEYETDLLTGKWWIKLSKQDGDEFFFDLEISKIEPKRSNRHKTPNYQITVPLSKKSTSIITAHCSSIEQAIECIASELSIIEIADTSINDASGYVQQAFLDAITNNTNI